MFSHVLQMERLTLGSLCFVFKKLENILFCEYAVQIA
jgi:hypothetical protein